MTFSYFELFAGIGGFRLGLDKLGGICKGYSENNNSAIKVYESNFRHKAKNFGDITTITQYPKRIDLVVGGVPCQAWSAAGKNKGFRDQRGALWKDTIKAIAMMKPKVFIFENVYGLADPRHRSALNLILSKFKKLGYHTRWQILGANQFGLPQNRQRIFLVGFKAKKYAQKFSFPKPKKSKTSLAKTFNIKMPKTASDVPKIVFADLRGGTYTISSWDLKRISKRLKDFCVAFRSIRRRIGKRNYNKDGHPLLLSEIKKEYKTITKKDLDFLIKKKIFKKINNRYDYVNSKYSMGIDGVFRVFSPASPHFSTLKTARNTDQISLIPFKGKTPTEVKNHFISEIWKKGKTRFLTKAEMLQLQGFPKRYKINVPNYEKLLGNAVPPIIIKEITKSILKTGVFS